MDTTRDLQNQPLNPHVSQQVTTGNPPVEASPSAGISLSPPPENPQPEPRKRKHREMASTRFLSQDTAARRLGHSYRWLREQALRHPFYVPTTGPTKRGSPAFYTPEHVDAIYEYLCNKDLMTEDEAYRAWMAERQERVSKRLEKIKPETATRGRKAGKK